MRRSFFFRHKQFLECPLMAQSDMGLVAPHMSAIGGQSGHAVLHCKCPLMAQSGHQSYPFQDVTGFRPDTMLSILICRGGGNEAARIHHID